MVAAGGLPAILGLAEQADFISLLAGRLTVDCPNAPLKARSLVAGMLAGADDIDGTGILRTGGTPKVMGGVRAPSTLGTFLRSFTHGHVLQLGAVNRKLLEHLAPVVPGLFGADPLITVDLDDTIRELHGYRKQGVAYGYNKVKGLNAILAVVSSDSCPPVITGAGLRRGNVKSGDHAAWHATRSITLARTVRPGTQILGRADSAFCTCETIHAFADHGCWFSVTIPAWPTVTAAISGIDEQAWTPIRYPHAVIEPETGELISDAEVAETPFTAFVSHPKDEQVSCRLVVRRVKRLNPAGQDPLVESYRYHAFITNSDLDTVEADRRHRDHAIVEQVIAELKAGPLAHLPSGRFTANAAWLACAVIAFNLSRAAAHAAGMSTARMPTITRRLIMIPARIAHRARRRYLHMPRRWPWATQFTRLWTTATAVGPPLALAS
ncbi:IS1380 family transposase [Acidipropionibacterium acidipropionici]|uniref:IS1380 family transposase n=1 Tax=Acidipropionibacterium acidipropionici TaxID=1748 RepID=UPI0018DD84F6